MLHVFAQHSRKINAGLHSAESEFEAFADILTVRRHEMIVMMRLKAVVDSGFTSVGQGAVRARARLAVCSRPLTYSLFQHGTGVRGLCGLKNTR
jgi:hypothetical protein